MGNTLTTSTTAKFIMNRPQLVPHIIEFIAREYVQNFHEDRAARILPLLTSCKQLYHATLPHLYHTVFIRNGKQWSALHQHATTPSLRSVRHLVIGPRVSPSRVGHPTIASASSLPSRHVSSNTRSRTRRQARQRDSGASTKGKKKRFDRPPNRDWLDRRADIGVGSERARETNLEHLEINGCWGWTHDPMIVEIWRPRRWTMRQRDFEECGAMEGKIFRGLIQKVGVLCGVKHMVFDLSEDYKHFKEHYHEAEIVPSETICDHILDETTQFIDHKWWQEQASQAITTWTCEQRPQALPTRSYEALRLKIVGLSEKDEMKERKKDARDAVDVAFELALHRHVLRVIDHLSGCSDPECGREEPLTNTIEGLTKDVLDDMGVNS